jgi:hypothetical protein
MGTTGFIVDVDNFGDSDPSTPSPTLPYSAVLHPLAGFGSFERDDSPKT